MNATKKNKIATLYLEPQNGLCNRLRAIDSTIALAHDHRARIEVLWNMWDGMNCDLVELICVPTSIENIWYWSSISRRKKLLKRVRELRIRAAGGQFFGDADMLSARGFEAAGEALARGAPVYIKAYSRFYERTKPYDWLKPRDTVRQGVTKIWASVSIGPVIGVHIRRETPKKAQQHSPLKLFLQKMETELQRNPDVKFFLSTDSKMIETEVMTQFKNKVVVATKSAYTRVSKQDAIEAMIDLLCLAKTSKVIGSYWSSFSRTAAEIGGIELELAHQGKA